jgi:hypothetical protein
VCKCSEPRGKGREPARVLDSKNPTSGKAKAPNRCLEVELGERGEHSKSVDDSMHNRFALVKIHHHGIWANLVG